MSSDDIEQFYRERERQYQDLNIREHVDGERYIVDCPGCETPMILGEGWMGCRIPECPDCNQTADSWTSDPRISVDRAEALADGPADVTGLVRS
jgi:peptide subunit release factor 1 (eRF1)